MDAQFFTRYGTPIDTSKLAKIEGDSATYIAREKCSRCGGSGTTPWGTCFRCRGNGRELPREHRAYTAERLAQVEGAAERRRVTAQARKDRVFEERRAEGHRRAVVFEQANAEEIARIRACAARNSFLTDLLAKLEQWGYLSGRQMAAAANACQRCEDRAVEDARARQSEHLGTVGERREFLLTTVRAIELPPSDRFIREAARFVFICDDEHRNRVVYIGSGSAIGADPGAVSRIRATVKAHSERDGVKQTLVNRPSGLEKAVSAPVVATPEPKVEAEPVRVVPGRLAALAAALTTKS